MSVGHAARAFEAAGIPTVTIAVASFQSRVEMMSLPRVLLTSQLLGRPMGSPFEKEQHLNYLSTAVQLLETASENGTIKMEGTPS